VKTDQAECAYLDAPMDEESTENGETEKPVAEKKPATEKRKRKPQPVEPNENYRSTIALNDANTEIKEEGAVAGIIGEKALSDIPTIIPEEPAKLEQPIETVPERILKIAEAIKEESGDTKDKMIIVEVKEENVAENSKEEKSEHAKETEATA